MKTNFFFFLFLSLLSPELFAGKNLSTHSHGKVKLDLAMEGDGLFLMLKAPSESFLDFEYRPKTAKEKKAVAKLKASWPEDALAFLDESYRKKCTLNEKKWEQKFTGHGHSEILAEAKIICKGGLAGRPFIVALKKKYPKIHMITFQILRKKRKVDVLKITQKERKVIL